MKQLKYLKYVIIHKYYVFEACVKLQVPLLQALFHDISKLSPAEFTAYATKFYSSSKLPEIAKHRYKRAWLHHIHHNPHHWEHWIIPGKPNTILPIPDKYRKEMLADWIGAGKAQSGTDNTQEWYMANRHKIILHPKTRKWVEGMLDIHYIPK